MKNNSWIAWAIRGMGIGFPSTLLCMTLIGGYNEVIAEFLTWMVASALFGIISELIFSKSNFSLPVATAVHCVCCLVVAAAAGAICGYADSFGALLAGILPVFVVVYVVIYILVFLSMKQEEKKINQALNEK